MAERIWVRVPDDSVLSRIDGWNNLGDNLYSALRWHFLIIGQRDGHTKSGPSFFEYEVPARATYTYTNKKVSTVKRTASIQESLKASVSSKLSEEISSKLSSEISGGTSLSAKLQSEVQAKSVSEVVESLGRDLSQTNSYEVQNAEEVTDNISLAPGDGTSGGKSLKLYFFLGLWPWRWDVYLHSVEYLRLEYRRRFLVWGQVRNTIVKATHEPKQPVCQIVHYVPQDKPSIREQSYTPEVSDITISINPPAASAGTNVRLPSDISSLEDLARVAFPVSDEERAHATKKRALKGGAKGGSGAKGGGVARKGGAKGSASGGRSSKGGSKSSRGGSKGGGKK
ncbi:MAG TPA: hypothetical protein VGB98_08020 [Pyrinomonadaceae bacterium]|jgi:hypothetical protein